MTRIGIVGAGMAATLHAQAATISDRVELVGVGGGAGAAAELAAAAQVPDLAFDALVERSDAVVVAVPPPLAPEVVAALSGRVGALLVEAPAPEAIGPVDVPAMVGANLLHSPVVRRGLRAIAEMASPHHLQLRSSQPAPKWGDHGTVAFGGAGLDPGARLAPVLLAAGGSPAITAEARLTIGGSDDGDPAPVEERAEFRMQLADGRSVTLDSRWADGSARAELEVADEQTVTTITLLPTPEVELDGTPLSTEREHPLAELGFVSQLERLASLSDAGGTPWRDLTSGINICTLLTRAINEARI